MEQTKRGTKNMNTTFEKKQGKEDWITPPEIIKKLGHFNLDPCTSHYQKELYADNNYYIEQNGLTLPWFGRVWCNPPYGDKASDFIKK